MKRVAFSLLAGLIVVGFSWLLGFNFNERGVAAFFTAYAALAACALTYAFPGWAE